ncbi:helix-turn-helix domain-containing protein [Hungatella effluvii]|uniref:helix-turn-helix domain-containing protein n=1 Tax=Hungatella effluvii TaxID=1096246 RepID=UPI0022E0E042|nr:helix-turn-helix transcriptional regulator [Hungatella effluvii]
MEKQQLKEIGQRLRLRRTELGLTREALSELADIGAGYYGQLEVGTSQMSIDTLIKLHKSMHLPLEYILFGTTYQKGNPDPFWELLDNCTEREIALAKKILVLYLMKIDD